MGIKCCQRLTAALKFLFRFEFLFLTAILCAFKFPNLKDSVIPAHDGLYTFEVFHFFYNALYSHGEFPLWAPYGFMGVQTDYFINNFLGPMQVLVGGIGLLLRVENILLLYKVSVFFQFFLFLTGNWLLSRELFRHRVTRWVVTLSLTLGVFSLLQIFFDLIFLYTVPLTLFFIFRFFRVAQGLWFYLALLSAALGMWGNIGYFGVIYLYFYLIVLVCLSWGRWSTWRALLKWNVLSALVLTLALAASATYLLSVQNEFSNLHFYPTGERDPETYRSTLRDFLTYNGTPSLREIAAEFVLGKSFMGDLSLYVGLLPIFFFAASTLQNRSREFWAFFAVFLFFGAVALGGLLAEAVYHLPLFSYYRHIGYLWGIAKIPLVFAAGFALEALAARVSEYSRSPSPHFPWKEFWKGVPLPLIALPALFFISQKDLWTAPYFQFSSDTALAVKLFAFRLGVFAILMAVLGWVALRHARFLYHGVCLGAFAFVMIDAGSFHWGRRTLFPLNPDPKEYRALTHTSPWEYRGIRADFPIFPKDDLADRFYNRSGGVRYVMHHNFDRTESIPPTGRMDFISTGLFDLLQARGFRFLQEPDKPSQDAPLAAALAYFSPKLYFTGDPVYAANEEAARKWIESSSHFDARPVLISKTPPPRPIQPAPTPGVIPFVKGVERFSPNCLRISVKVPGPCFLTYADAWHPHWKVYVNGEAGLLYKANLAFKAVALKGGETTVEFRFEHFNWLQAGWLFFTLLGALFFVGPFLILLTGREVFNPPTLESARAKVRNNP